MKSTAYRYDDALADLDTGIRLSITTADVAMGGFDLMKRLAIFLYGIGCSVVGLKKRSVVHVVDKTHVNNQARSSKFLTHPPITQQKTTPSVPQLPRSRLTHQIDGDVVVIWDGLPPECRENISDFPYAGTA